MTRALSNCLFLALLAGFQSSVASAQPKSAQAVNSEAAAPRPVATVNGEPIHAEDLERVLADLHSGAAAAPRSDFDVDRLIFRLVNDALLSQEARTLQFHEEPPIPEQLRRRRNALAKEYLERVEIWDKAEPSDEQVRSAFEKEYRKATFRMMTADDREKAEALLAELQEGADFEALARERSVDHYQLKGGLVSNADRIDLPAELGAVLFGLRPGQTAGPIRTNLGWANIRAESFELADPKRFERLEPLIRRVVRFRNGEQLRQELGSRLREAHPVKIDWQIVEAIECERRADGRLLPVVAEETVSVIEVGGAKVSAGSFGAELEKRWRGVRNREAALAAKPIVLDRLVLEALTLAEAVQRGYDRTPEVDRDVAAFERQLLVKRYLGEVIAPSVEIDSREIETFYIDNRDQFRKAPRVQIGQITVAQRDEAEEIIELLRAGTDLPWLARQRSIDKYKEAGGNRGWVVPSKGSDPFNQGLRAAKAGDVLGPLALDESFVVIRVYDRQEQGYDTVEEASGRIRSALFRQQFQEALHQHLQLLRDRSEIVLHDEVIADLRFSASPAESGSHSFGGDGGVQEEEPQP